MTDAHDGKAALELSAVGSDTEVQCTSQPMLVDEGKTYDLTARVKQTAGMAGYKVTLNWLGAGGHLKCDNDWKGDDRPTDWTRHGGRFVAPEGARAVVIILGVREGTKCVFDGIALDQAE